jgi:hypothetical protein
MSDDPADTGFGISKQGVLDFASSLGGADSLVEAFPAALLAAVWRALLEADVVETPARVDAQRVEVLLVGPNQLELRVPVRSRYAEFVKVVPVWVGNWLAKGALENQIGDEAEQLANALERADSNPVFEHSPGQGQKPHN